MEQMLAPVLDMLRAAPWLVWFVSMPAVVAIRNHGLARASELCPDRHSARVLAVVLGTLFACTAIAVGAALSYAHLAQ